MHSIIVVESETTAKQSETECLFKSCSASMVQKCYSESYAKKDLVGYFHHIRQSPFKKSYMETACSFKEYFSS